MPGFEITTLERLAYACQSEKLPWKLNHFPPLWPSSFFGGEQSEQEAQKQLSIPHPTEIHVQLLCRSPSMSPHTPHAVAPPAHQFTPSYPQFPQTHHFPPPYLQFPPPHHTAPQNQSFKHGPPPIPRSRQGGVPGLLYNEIWNMFRTQGRELALLKQQQVVPTG